MLRDYLTSLLAFIMVDAVWLGIIAPSFYRAHIDHLMSAEPDLIAAGLFYLIFLAGLNLFVIHPCKHAKISKVIGYGAAYGAVTYATFDLTAVAVFKDFPYLVAGVDLIWGATLSLAVASITIICSRDRGQLVGEGV